MTKKLNIYAAIVRALPAKLEKSATLVITGNLSGQISALLDF